MSFFGAIGGLLGGAIGTLVAPGIGTAIGAGIGMSAGGSIDSSNAVSEANDTNLQSVRETNALNKELAEKNIAYQQRENQRNRDFNAAEAQKAFEREKEMFMFQANYNSPMEQVKRAAAAGINPASVMGQGSSVAASGPSNGAASYGTGVSPSMPNMVAGQVAPVPGMATGLIDSLKQLSEAKQAFSQSGLNDAQSHKILTLLESELEGQVLDNQTKEFALEMEKAFGPAMRKASVQKLVMDGLLAYRQCENALAEGDKLRADAALSRSVTALNDAKKQTEGKQQALLDKQISGYDKELKARINNLDAGAYAARQQGASTAEVVKDQQRRNKVMDMLNHSIHGKGNLYVESIRATLQKAIEDKNLTNLEYHKLSEILPSLVQEANNAARKGEPWTYEYFIDRLMGVGANVAGNAALLMLK